MSRLLTEYRKRIARLAEQRGGRITAQDVAVVLSSTQVEATEALQEFASIYESNLGVEEHTKKLRYQFVMPLKRRPQSGGVGSLLIQLVRRALSFFFQVGLGLIISIYGGALLICLLGFGGDGAHHVRQVVRRLGSTPSDAWVQILGFARRVQRFVLEPSVADDDPAAQLERIYTFIANNAGVISTADVMALTGCSYSKADRFLTWLRTVDKAEVRATSEGILLYVFPEFRRRGQQTPTRSDWAWNRLPKQWMESRFSSENGDVILLICLALVGSTALEFFFVYEDWSGNVLRFLVADIPCAASFISLVLPLYRWGMDQNRSAEMGTRVLRAAIMEVLHDRGEAFGLSGDFDASKNHYPGLKRRDMLENMNGVVTSIRGEITVLADRTQAVDSSVLRNEWAASLRARDRVLSGSEPPGAVVNG
jgi:hypothetical protein